MRAKHAITTIGTMAFAALFGAAHAQQDDSVAQFVEMWTEPQEFYLQEWTSSETFVFNEQRPVRICASTAAEAQIPVMQAEEGHEPVPLEVRHSRNSEMTLDAGDCAQFQAQRVTVTPAGSIDAGWTLRGEISSRPPG